MSLVVVTVVEMVGLVSTTATGSSFLVSVVRVSDLFPSEPSSVPGSTIVSVEVLLPILSALDLLDQY